MLLKFNAQFSDLFWLKIILQFSFFFFFLWNHKAFRLARQITMNQWSRMHGGPIPSPSWPTVNTANVIHQHLWFTKPAGCYHYTPMGPQVLRVTFNASNFKPNSSLGHEIKGIFAPICLLAESKSSQNGYFGVVWYVVWCQKIARNS